MKNSLLTMPTYELFKPASLFSDAAVISKHRKAIVAARAWEKTCKVYRVIEVISSSKSLSGFRYREMSEEEINLILRVGF